ncbi:MAG: sulfatase-like hydrolase/transferase [Deltaproteobacteria bacterium]|nr:sulfatase-like hydrolase/transferase [Deltaproteobacteria bacterium]
MKRSEDSAPARPTWRQRLGSPWLWLALGLAWAFVGTDLVCQVITTSPKAKLLLPLFLDPDRVVQATLRLGCLVLAGVALHGAALRSPRRWPRRWFVGLTTVLCIVFLLRAMSWYGIKAQVGMEMIAYVVWNPKLLGDAPGFLSSIPRFAWLASFPFVLFWSAFLVTASRRSGSESTSAVPSMRRTGLTAGVVAGLLGLSFVRLPVRLTDWLIEHAHGVTGDASLPPAEVLSQAHAWPGPEVYRPERRVPESFYVARGGKVLPAPTVVVVFVLESAREEWVDLKASKYFSHPEHSISVPEFFVPVPHSANSHYSLFTGLYSERKAEVRFDRKDASMPASFVDRGYRGVYLYGGESAFDDETKMLRAVKLENLDKEELVRRSGKPALFGWGVDDAILTTEAKKLIDEATSAKPLFLSVIWTNSHHPYPELEGVSYQKYGDDEAGRHRTAIDRCVAMSDDIVLHLERRGVPFVAVLVSDHGESFGEHGFRIHDFSLYNPEVKVPFSVYAPTLVRPAGELPRYGTILDVWPTLGELLGEPVTAPIHGRSLFDPNYRLKLVLRSWRNSDSTGLLLGDEKWIYSAPDGRVRLFDLSDREKVDLPAASARRFVDGLEATELFED